MNSAFVNGAGHPSHAVSTASSDIAPVHVVAVSTIHADRAPVYDLTIDAVSEFFANGILVHNSLDALRYAVMLVDRQGVFFG